MRDLTDDMLYRALLARDPAYEGRALVGVTSTGIFCRLTCPARKPLARNCRWFADAASARDAGFRPCLRCRPEQVALPPVVAELLDALRADPERRWSEGDLKARGLDPSTVRRQFRQHMGRSFLQMARDARLRQGMGRIAMGDDVIEAQLDAGFDSASGFRAAFRRLFGHAPQDLRGGGDLAADWIETPLGGMIAIVDDSSLHLLEFVDRKALPQGLARLSRMVGGRIGLGRRPMTDRVEAALGDFFAGRDGRLDLPVTLHGTEFQRAVWTALRDIAPGATCSYAGLAAAMGRPSAVRAVASANANNRLALVIPCHRVIGSDGRLAGYAGGLWRKERLISLEASYRDPGANRVDAGLLPL